MTKPPDRLDILLRKLEEKEPQPSPSFNWGGKIDTRLSVTEKQQELGNRQLEKLNDIISSARRPAR